MIHRPPWLLLAAACGALLLGLSGCAGSPAARFYTLTSLQETQEANPVERAERRGIVAVGPVELADYLDRPQLVRRTAPTTVDLLELDRWAGSLPRDVARVLVDNLAGMLAPQGFSVVSWEETSRPDARIQVSVNRFEATHQETVVLHALWILKGPEQGEILATGNEAIVEPIAGAGTSETVEAMSRALAELSRRITDAGKRLRLQDGAGAKAP